jgi:hypothetical protein
MIFFVNFFVTFFAYFFLKLHLHHFSNLNVFKKSQNSRSQGFFLKIFLVKQTSGDLNLVLTDPGGPKTLFFSLVLERKQKIPVIPGHEFGKFLILAILLMRALYLDETKYFSCFTRNFDRLKIYNQVCVALRCVALRCDALRCVALRCVALRGVAWRGVAWRGVAWQSIIKSYTIHISYSTTMFRIRIEMDLKAHT